LDGIIDEDEELFSKPVRNEISSYLTKSVNRAYDCNVCYELMQEPLVLKCGHSCCAKCVEKLPIKQSPECKMVFTKTKKNYTVQSIIEALEILCPFGCEETLTIGDLEMHQKNCECYVWKCLRCEEEVKENQSVIHSIKKCPHRRIRCKCDCIVILSDLDVRIEISFSFLK